MYRKIIIFIVFVLVGFAMIAGMLHLFIFLQEQIGNGEVTLIKSIKENLWPITYAVWIFMALGLLVALPAMMKDGFFGGEPATVSTVSNNKIERMPAQALPPLEHQIKSSVLIILTRTQANQDRVWYYIIDILKSGSSPNQISKDSVVNINTKMWELLGYKPIAGQEVVFFFTEDGLINLSPLETLTVQDGKIIYGKDDPTIKQELTIEELQKKVLL